MTLKELLEEERGIITVTGEVDEVRTFAYCLEETLTKGRMKEELQELIEEVEEGNYISNQFNFSAIHRIYYKAGKILFGANAHDKKFYYPILKKNYDEAKQLYQQGISKKT